MNYNLTDLNINTTGNNNLSIDNKINVNMNSNSINKSSINQSKN